jgi:hypothetical protein
MHKPSPILCFLTKGFDILFYLVAIATVAGSITLLFTDYNETSIIEPLLIANAVVFIPILMALLWMMIRKQSVSPRFSSLAIAAFVLLVSPIPYLAILYGFKTIPESLKDILLGITALSPIYTSFVYMVFGLLRDCVLCHVKGCDL